MAAMLNGAGCLAWAAGVLRVPDIDALLARVGHGYRGPSPVLFLPYLSGERTPHNNPHARGVWFGMTAATTADDLVQAVLEGVAFSFAEAQLCLGEGLPDTVAAIGGGTRSALWMQIMADVLDRRVIRYRDAERGPAFGAARLARLAVTGERPEAVCTKPAVSDEFLPRPDRVAAYREPFARYRRLYGKLCDEFVG